MESTIPGGDNERALSSTYDYFFILNRDIVAYQYPQHTNIPVAAIPRASFVKLSVQLKKKWQINESVKDCLNHTCAYSCTITDQTFKNPTLSILADSTCMAGRVYVGFSALTKYHVVAR